MDELGNVRKPFLIAAGVLIIVVAAILYGAGFFSHIIYPSSTGASTSTSSNGVARLTIKGSTIYDPSGNPIVLRGFNWGAWDTAQQQDAADNIAQGANVIRIPLSWYFGSGAGATDCKTGQDSYDASAPGFINPANLALVDQEVAWASAQHLWINLMVRGGDCDFWTNPTVIPQYIQLWQFLANRYKNTPYIASYELLSEPHPPKPLSNTDVKGLYEKLIAAIHPIDPKTPFVVGAAKDYEIRNLEQVYLPDQTNVIYTANFFELPAYVKQVQGQGRRGSGGYPGNWQDQGSSSNTCNYPGKGQMVLMNKTWLAGLANCAVAFSTAHNVPIYINQVGVETAATGSFQYMEDVLDIFRTDNFNWTYWTYRAGSSEPGNNQSVLYEPTKNGPWLTKTNLLTMLSTYFKGGTTE